MYSLILIINCHHQNLERPHHFKKFFHPPLPKCSFEILNFILWHSLTLTLGDLGKVTFLLWLSFCSCNTMNVGVDLFLGALPLLSVNGVGGGGRLS